MKTPSPQARRSPLLLGPDGMPLKFGGSRPELAYAEGIVDTGALSSFAGVISVPAFIITVPNSYCLFEFFCPAVTTTGGGGAFTIYFYLNGAALWQARVGVNVNCTTPVYLCYPYPVNPLVNTFAVYGSAGSAGINLRCAPPLVPMWARVSGIGRP